MNHPVRVAGEAPLTLNHLNISSRSSSIVFQQRSQNNLIFNHSTRRWQNAAMLFSTIGRCAVIQLVFSLVASTPPTAADQFFRGSRLHHTVDGCTSFTEKSSCLAGTAGCTWHPQDGCVSASSTTETSERVFLTGGEEKNNGDDEASLRVSRKLQNVKATRKPTSNPTTRTPSSKPTAKVRLSIDLLDMVVRLYSPR